MHRDHRLKRAADFRAIRERGKSWADRRLVLVALPRPKKSQNNGEDENGGPSRFGFSVSKRIGNAVARNAIKRRLRATVREADVASGWDVLIIARKGLIGSDYSDIGRSMQDLLARAGIRTGIRNSASRRLAPGKENIESQL